MNLHAPPRARYGHVPRKLVIPLSTGRCVTLGEVKYDRPPMSATDQDRREPIYASVQASLRAFVGETALNRVTAAPERELARGWAQSTSLARR